MRKRYAIGVLYDSGLKGYFLGEDLKIKTYTTEEEAQKALRRMLRNDGYSWNCDVRVFELKDKEK